MKYFPGTKSLYQRISFFYVFETMIKKWDEDFSTGWIIFNWFWNFSIYLKDVKCKNNIFVVEVKITLMYLLIKWMKTWKKDFSPSSQQKKIQDEEKKLYLNKAICYLCGKEFDKSNKMLIKVIEHCYYLGEYRGAVYLVILENSYIPLTGHNS